VLNQHIKQIRIRFFSDAQLNNNVGESWILF
jgi:hypothetical protein